VKRRRDLALIVLAAVAAVFSVSGSARTGPLTPAGLPGMPAPFLGTAVIGGGNSSLRAAVDSYATVVDVREAGPASEPAITIPYKVQVAGSVPTDSGISLAVSAGRRPPLPLWEADRIGQRYLGQTNALQTRATVAGARIEITDAISARDPILIRRIRIRGRPDQPLLLELYSDREPGCAGSRPALRQETDPDGARATQAWRARGELRLWILCRFSADGRSEMPTGTRGPAELPAALLRQAEAADRAFLARARPLGPSAPRWASGLYRRSLLALRALADSANGAVAAGLRDHWAYVWPRDAAAVAMAFSAAGYRPLARRVVEFLLGLDLDAGARFRGDGEPVDDGRERQGDTEGWIRAAASAVGLADPYAGEAPDWRDRADYGEQDGGDHLANAIAGGETAAAISEEFGGADGLHRFAGDDSQLDSAAAWAVTPFPVPGLVAEVRRTLDMLLSQGNRFGITPTTEWPDPDPWTAPTAWTAWALALLGDDSAARRCLLSLRHAATPLGLLPERVDDITGLPRSTTPLAWSHAFAILALRQLYR
jgi:hypothetical protein